MNRYQIQLDERLATDLKSLARQRDVSFAQVVRDAVVTYLETERPRSFLDAIRPAVGSGRDIEGRTDISERHDEFAWEH